jgi:DNA replication protein DnaC
MGNREEVIKRLLSIRGDRRDRITLISSNIPLNHKLMTDTYGDRVVSRLEEMCNYFELVGKDRRRM